MQKIVVFLSFLLSLVANSQQSLRGIVTDIENKPIPSASVFLNSTSIGTGTNEQGKFELAVPAGKFDLIVSSVGYETFSQTIVAGSIPGFMTIKLKIKPQELEAVVIEPNEKNGWERWGHFFLESFIGTSALADQCRIKNSAAIKFRNSKKKNELTAYAMEPLIIENKALGYTIHYQLEAFTYDFQTHFLFYEGYPFFEPMKGNAGKQKKWEKRRGEVYYGGMMHFMRSVFRNKIAEEGFQVYALQKFPNTEKRRVKEAYEKNQRRTESANGTVIVTTINKDSAAYYEKILHQEDYIDVVEKNVLTGDKIAYAMDSVTAVLDFKNYLLVIYKNKIAPLEYRQQYPRNSTAMMSQLVLINQRPVEIEANGNYYDPADLVSSGYWSWSEKTATILPLDYQPPKN